ncbi:MAG: LamG domain-containing protein, partial [Candidatus Nealsonbacteria bacterium]|nr:LamG domain-containing protein [Candidatus Nealsonbacteria bacterium]
ADGTYNASVDWASPVWVDNAFNGNAVMRFDGTNQQRLSFTEYMDMESVLWVVQENEGASGRNPLLGDGDYYPFNRQEGGGPMVGGYASPEVRDGVTTLNGGQIDIMAVPPPNEMGIIGVVMTGPLTQIDAFGGPSNGIPTGVSQIGQDRFEDTRSWDGDFADIIIYNRQLTTAEMTQMTRHLAFRYSIPVEQPMEDFSGVDMTVTADSTLEVGGTVDIGLAGLTLQGGTLTTTGSATSISFTGTTVDVDPASDLEAGLNPQTATTYGAGPLELKHGVIKTSGDVTFNGVNIPATATAVGFNPGGTTTYGTIQANNTSAVISKTGPGVMVLNPGDLLNVNSNATLEARGGTLAIGGSGGFAGASNALLNGGTMRIHAGALTEAHVKQMSMVGAWLFDEGSGSVASNSAGAGAGTITGATWVDDFDRGWVLDFEDADNVNISDPGSVFGSIVDTQSVSISVWQYGDDMIQPQSDWLFEGHNDGGRQLSSHLPWSDGQVYWDAFGNYDRINKAAETSEVSGQWNHWVFTREGGVMKMFLNGEEWHSGTGMTRAFSNISTFRIGSEWNGNNSYDGMIDEFLVFNQPLDATAVEDLYLNGVTFTALPAISMTDRDFTVAADSTLHAASDTTAAFGALTVESGTVTIAGAPGGVSFTSLTVNAPGSEGGVNLGTSATFGGPVALQAGVLKTEGLPVTFNGVDIPVTATAVGLNPISQTNYGGIDGNLMSGTVAKTGPGKLSLATGDATAMTNATWVAQEGTLEMVGAASWGGSTNATLAGGTMVLTDVEG